MVLYSEKNQEESQLTKQAEEYSRQVTSPEFFDDFHEEPREDENEPMKSNEEQSTDSQEEKDLKPTETMILAKPKLTRADQLDLNMSKLRYGDEYQGPSDFMK